ncbi:hypothetical protein, partial [Escherichia coli]|uniref:hypothetical protein n=1 Tax=Escherichia coli TaxID=562 RepID=UPI0019532A9D
MGIGTSRQTNGFPAPSITMARIDSGIAVSEVGVSDQYGTVLWNDRPAVDQRLRQINRKALPRAILNRST